MSGRAGASRRAILAEARQSRRPSRLGSPAGAAAKPDHLLDEDAGFPGLLKDAWRAATRAADLGAAVQILLTLDGHVPADVQLRALGREEEAALFALCGVTWRDGRRASPARGGEAGGGGWARAGSGGVAGGRGQVFLGEIGLATNGRIAVRVPSGQPLAGEVDLVDGVLRVPWSTRTLAAYRVALGRAAERSAAAAADCRAWLAAEGGPGRDELLALLQDASLRTAPFVLYQEGRQYTNFRGRNTITGKTLWAGHPDDALSSLRGLPLGLWSDNDVTMVVCLVLLVRAGGYARIEEANGTQLTLDHVAHLLEESRRRYNAVPGGATIAPAGSARAAALDDLARALGARRPAVARTVQLYREIHGALMHKVERVAAPPGEATLGADAELAAWLREGLPVDGRTLQQLGDGITRDARWLIRPYGTFGTGLEALVYATVRAATEVFDADFAMSRGMRSLPELIQGLRDEDWARIVGWALPRFFCCVVPSPTARRYFGGSLDHLADTAWAISARMQYNCWHFLAGNLPKVPEVVARDHFVPPTIPDLAYFSDQHHRGHVAARVRWSIRSPQAVPVLDRIFQGFVDLRLLRNGGDPFDEADLLAAHRASGLIARATGAAAELAAAGAEVEVTSFDSRWHWDTIAGAAAPRRAPDRPGPSHRPARFAAVEGEGR